MSWFRIGVTASPNRQHSDPRISCCPEAAPRLQCTLCREGWTGADRGVAACEAVWVGLEAGAEPVLWTRALCDCGLPLLLASWHKKNHRGPFQMVLRKLSRSKKKFFSYILILIYLLVVLPHVYPRTGLASVGWACSLQATVKVPPDSFTTTVRRAAVYLRPRLEAEVCIHSAAGVFKQTAPLMITVLWFNGCPSARDALRQPAPRDSCLLSMLFAFSLFQVDFIIKMNHSTSGQQAGQKGTPENISRQLSPLL